MKDFKSKNTFIKTAPKAVFDFLSDFNNFKELMPDQVINWDATQNTCSFTIKNMADLGMKIQDRIPNSKIKMVAHGKVPFQFELNVSIDDSKMEESSVIVHLAANLNPMLSMMASKPLANFVQILADKLKVVMESN